MKKAKLCNKLVAALLSPAMVLSTVMPAMMSRTAGAGDAPLPPEAPQGQGSLAGAPKPVVPPEIVPFKNVPLPVSTVSEADRERLKKILSTHGDTSDMSDSEKSFLRNMAQRTFPENGEIQAKDLLLSPSEMTKFTQMATSLEAENRQFSPGGAAYSYGGAEHTHGGSQDRAGGGKGVVETVDADLRRSRLEALSETQAGSPEVSGMVTETLEHMVSSRSSGNRALQAGPHCSKIIEAYKNDPRFTEDVCSGRDYVRHKVSENTLRLCILESNFVAEAANIDRELSKINNNAHNREARKRVLVQKAADKLSQLHTGLTGQTSTAGDVRAFQAGLSQATPLYNHNGHLKKRKEHREQCYSYAGSAALGTAAASADYHGSKIGPSQGRGIAFTDTDMYQKCMNLYASVINAYTRGGVFDADEIDQFTMEAANSRLFGVEKRAGQSINQDYHDIANIQDDCKRGWGFWGILGLMAIVGGIILAVNRVKDREPSCDNCDGGNFDGDDDGALFDGEDSDASAAASGETGDVTDGGDDGDASDDESDSDGGEGDDGAVTSDGEVDYGGDDDASDDSDGDDGEEDIEYEDFTPRDSETAPRETEGASGSAPIDLDDDSNNSSNLGRISDVTSNTRGTLENSLRESEGPEEDSSDNSTADAPSSAATEPEAVVVDDFGTRLSGRKIATQ